MQSDTMDNYEIGIYPCQHRVRVSQGGTELADTRRALALDETGHERVFYIPVEDVRMELLVPSQHHSHCPLKGDASYWSLRLSGGSLENIAWAYEQPLPEVSEISGHLAFYRDRVDILDTD